MYLSRKAEIFLNDKKCICLMCITRILVIVFVILYVRPSEGPSFISGYRYAF